MESFVTDTFASVNFTLVNDSAKEISFPTQSPGFKIILNIAVSVTSLLSLIGSLAIILTFVIFKEIRTLGRQLLVCLSVADCLVAVASLLGLWTNFSDKLVGEYTNTTLYTWCKAQAAVHVFGTESSILWTMAVAIYMFVLVVIRPTRPRNWGIKLTFVLYILCWGIPFILTLWLAFADYLGYDLAATPGFCAIIGERKTSSVHPPQENPVVYPILIGYEIWLYLAFVVLPLLYISVRCRVRCKREATQNGGMSLVLKSRVKTQDAKLIFVPLVFMVLRVWSIVVDICVYYLPREARFSFLKSPASALLSILEGIGDTGQGAANGVLFCLLTDVVRVHLSKAMSRIYQRLSQGHSEGVDVGDCVKPDQNNIEDSNVEHLSASNENVRDKHPLLPSSTSLHPEYQSTNYS